METVMSTTEKRTISLPAEQASFIDAKVQSGEYASASEVVRAGLRALKERDGAVERWLQADVAETFDRMRAEPARGVSVDDAFGRLRAHHAKRLKEHR